MSRRSSNIAQHLGLDNEGIETSNANEGNNDSLMSPP